MQVSMTDISLVAKILGLGSNHLHSTDLTKLFDRLCGFGDPLLLLSD
jgi:hypothetical protein